MIRCKEWWAVITPEERWVIRTVEGWHGYTRHCIVCNQHAGQLFDGVCSECSRVYNRILHRANTAIAPLARKYHHQVPTFTLFGKPSWRRIWPESS